MRRCPFCSEPTAIDAPTCSSCGRVPPVRCESLTVVGARYGVGLLAGGGFATWDLVRGGDPVVTYPPGPFGRMAAYNEFTVNWNEPTRTELPAKRRPSRGEPWNVSRAWDRIAGLRRDALAHVADHERGSQ